MASKSFASSRKNHGAKWSGRGGCEVGTRCTVRCIYGTEHKSGFRARAHIAGNSVPLHVPAAIADGVGAGEVQRSLQALRTVIVHNAVLPVAGNLAALNTNANACTQAQIIKGNAMDEHEERQAELSSLGKVPPFIVCQCYVLLWYTATRHGGGSACFSP